MASLRCYRADSACVCRSDASDSACVARSREAGSNSMSFASASDHFQGMRRSRSTVFLTVKKTTFYLLAVASVSLAASNLKTRSRSGRALCDVYQEVENSALQQYEGSQGEEYFAWQSQNVEMGGQITALLFEPYTSETYKVLDFGCGSGTVVKNLRASERWCVEVNPMARKFSIANVKSLKKVVASVDDLPDNFFDLIISNHALEHTPCPLLTIRRLLNKLKQGGQVVFTTPSLQDELIYQRSLEHGDQKFDAKNDNNHHLYVWSSQQLGNLFQVAGYKIEEAKTKAFSRTSKTDAAWLEGGAKSFWAVAEIENRHPQTIVVATRTT